MAKAAESQQGSIDPQFKCPKGSSYQRFKYRDGSQADICKSVNKSDRNIILPRIEYHLNGKKKLVGQTKGSVPYGHWTIFDNSGKTIKEEEYDENGNPVCRVIEKIGATQTVIAYAKDTNLYPFATISGGQVTKFKGNDFGENVPATILHDQSTLTLKSSKPHSDVHTGECVFTLTSPRKFPAFSLAVIGSHVELNVPTKNELKEFYAANKSCVDQGDWPPEKKPQCTKPKLLAVSKLTGAEKEYWYTSPYLWDTGIAVGKIDSKSKKLIAIVENCDDCSD